jgi:hypothetical protein
MQHSFPFRESFPEKISRFLLFKRQSLKNSKVHPCGGIFSYAVVVWILQTSVAGDFYQCPAPCTYVMILDFVVIHP